MRINASIETTIYLLCVGSGLQLRTARCTPVFAYESFLGRLRHSMVKIPRLHPGVYKRCALRIAGEQPHEIACAIPPCIHLEPRERKVSRKQNTID